jgi:hypothetical protein
MSDFVAKTGFPLGFNSKATGYLLWDSTKPVSPQALVFKQTLRINNKTEPPPT